MKVVIVGGVAGGATAAARLRRLDESAEIVVFERSGYVSYANCGLPYYIGGIITDRAELTLQTPESFWRRFRVDMRVRHEVTAIHPDTKTVDVKNLATGEVFAESYDKLILSPGARPTQPALPGVGIDRLFTLRTVEDTLKLREFIEQHHPRSAVLAGGGFIGIELVENLRELGLDVTVVQRPKQLLNPLDADMAAFLHAQLREKGVKLMLGRTVEGFAADGDRVNVLIKDEAPLTADMVVLAIGVTPDTGLARDAGLELGIKGSIVVNDRMETSVPDIYAVGDAVQVKHSVTGQDALLSLAGPANKQGRIAADNICGGDSRYLGSQGSSVIKVFDMTIAATGVNEKTARQAGIDCDKVFLSPMSHAGYYPGGKVMTMKVVFEKGTYRLLGAQIVGYEGVDKRIDVLATAIHAGLTGPQLKDLDLAYAPPYSSAKDPVNMAGFMIENLSRGLVEQFFPEDVDALPRDGSATLLDVRTPGEYAAGHAEGFVNLPVDDLREHLAEIPADKPVYLICQSALRSYIACRILSQHGLRCSHLSGGWRLYTAVMQDQAAAQEALPCGMEK
ncbi:FAD-dependent oxidoreductase [Oscillibacter valericigenes]|uniref:FAD-dependent oxidoreductase n=1 Tax=Oscillibacter valericigenes TaxID=351091 RepID=A0ABS2FWY1_9FIRM|nr:FAD-dependent oxidoreductase [Oscillibacter valericigenes]MBM6851390.1 FAD-dependent oxidoreductase [Oscillibacter valericigenes]